MYFLVENKAKMGIGSLGYVKYSFWSQNNVILAIITFLNSKRSCFGLSRTKRHRFGLVLTYPKRHRLDKCSK